MRRFLDAGHHTLVRRWIGLAVILLVPLVFGAISVRLGRDNNWDLKNYHYYNAYAFLKGRLGFDIVPAQWQTFFNPLLDLPFYWMTRRLPSRFVGFVLGWMHGLNLVLVYLIFGQLAARSRRLWGPIAGVGLVLVSGYSPGFHSELGTTMNDNVTSLFVLGSLFLLLQATDRFEAENQRGAALLLHLAGLTIGLGAGLKPTIASYAAACALSLVILRTPWLSRITYSLLYGLSAAFGVALTAGYWWWILWERFQSPFFPFLNSVFESPVLTTPFLPFGRFLPQSLLEYLTWPLVFSLDSRRVSQIRFWDVRFALIYMLSLLWLALVLWRRLRPPRPAEPPPSNPLVRGAQADLFLVFFFLSFVLWMVGSSVYRYLIPLELLAPLCFFVVATRLRVNTRMLTAILLTGVIAGAVLLRTYGWGRLPWSDPYIEVDTRPFVEQVSAEGAVVIMLGTAPTSYVIPEFPENFRFIRPVGYLELRSDAPIFEEMESLVRESRVPLFVLYDTRDPNVHIERGLARLNLKAELVECALLIVNTPDKLELCRLVDSDAD